VPLLGVYLVTGPGRALHSIQDDLPLIDFGVEHGSIVRALALMDGGVKRVRASVNDEDKVERLILKVTADHRTVHATEVADFVETLLDVSRGLAEVDVQALLTTTPLTVLREIQTCGVGGTGHSIAVKMEKTARQMLPELEKLQEGMTLLKELYNYKLVQFNSSYASLYHSTRLAECATFDHTLFKDAVDGAVKMRETMAMEDATRVMRETMRTQMEKEARAYAETLAKQMNEEFIKAQTAKDVDMA
jgi:hypothetical protein